MADEKETTTATVPDNPVDHENEGLVEEESTAEFTPVVELPEQETRTGEEDEEVIYKVRARLFRYDNAGLEWKERGVGEVKLLKHRENKKIRILMRRDQTKKICMNHYVNVSTELQENISSDRSWVWSAIDYADEERDECVLAIRFKDSQTAEAFKAEYNKAKAFMAELLGVTAADGDDDDDDDDDDGKVDGKEETRKEESTEAAPRDDSAETKAENGAAEETAKAES